MTTNAPRMMPTSLMLLPAKMTPTACTLARRMPSKRRNLTNMAKMQHVGLEMQTAKLNPAQANLALGMTCQMMPTSLILLPAKLNPTPCILAKRMHRQRTKLTTRARLHAGQEMPTAKLNTAQASLTTRMTCQMTRLSSRLHTPK